MLDLFDIIRLIILWCFGMAVYYVYWYIQRFNLLKNINNKINDYLDYRNNTKIIILTDKEKKDIKYDPISLSDLIIDVIQIDDYDKLFDIIDNLNPNTKNIEFVINSRGGCVSSNDIMISIIRNLTNKYNVNAHVYNYAMSAATMLVLACGRIYMNDYCFLTPTDPQIYLSEDDVYQSKDILCANSKKINFDNKLLFNQTKRYHKQNIKTVGELLKKHIKDSNNLNKLLELFTSGNNLHITPYNKHMLRSYGMLIYNSNVELKNVVDNIFDLLE